LQEQVDTEAIVYDIDNDIRFVVNFPNGIRNHPGKKHLIQIHLDNLTHKNHTIEYDCQAPSPWGVISPEDGTVCVKAGDSSLIQVELNNMYSLQRSEVDFLSVTFAINGTTKSLRIPLRQTIPWKINIDDKECGVYEAPGLWMKDLPYLFNSKLEMKQFFYLNESKKIRFLAVSSDGCDLVFDGQVIISRPASQPIVPAFHLATPESIYDIDVATGWHQWKVIMKSTGEKNQDNPFLHVGIADALSQQWLTPQSWAIKTPDNC
jgi:hypothetical protein